MKEIKTSKDKFGMIYENFLEDTCPSNHFGFKSYCDEANGDCYKCWLRALEGDEDNE